jgi:hypothetical protein
MNTFLVGAILLVLVPVVLVALPAVLAARRTASERRSLLTHGSVAEAEVLSCEPCDEGLLLRYRYIVPGRSSPVESSALVAHHGRAFSVGAKVQVRYKASVPGVSVLVPEGESHAA